MEIDTRYQFWEKFHLFKIDLIVWKLLGSTPIIENFSGFKIDLIVWKF